MIGLVMFVQDSTNEKMITPPMWSQAMRATQSIFEFYLRAKILAERSKTLIPKLSFAGFSPISRPIQESSNWKSG